MPAMNGGRGGSNGRNGSSQNESPSSAFSNWRKQNTGNNVAPGFKKALQLQCKWMLLCLKKAEAEKTSAKSTFPPACCPCWMK